MDPAPGPVYPPGVNEPTVDPEQSPDRPESPSAGSGRVPVRSRAALAILSFGSGFAVMVLEIAGARLMAPVFGLSAVPWTAIIGVVLAALAWGSHLGGKWADEGRVPLSVVLLVAAIAATVPLLAPGLPYRTLELAGFIPGALLSAVLFFAPPVLALGTVVPYLVKADTATVEEVGRRAGDMSALATAGSIAGTFATGFLLLPLMPLQVLIAGTAASIAGLAALAAWSLRDAGPPPAATGGTALLLLALGVLGGSDPESRLHHEETVYASISVWESEWSDGRMVRELRQNGSSSSAEYVDTGLPAHDYTRVSGILLDEAPVGPPRSALVLGGAALTLPVAFRVWRPEMEIDVVEVDPAVTRLAAEYFAYGDHVDDPRFRVHHADARYFLARTERRWDLVYLDVFDHLVTVPWPMITREALELYRSRLTDRGFVMVNILTPVAGPGRELLDRFVRTAKLVYPEVRAWPVTPGEDPEVVQNVIVILATDAAHLPDGGDELVRVGEGEILTDAHAPVEFLQARLLMKGLGW